MDRALVVTPRFPWPLDDGGKIALWQTVWSAAQEFRTTLISLVSPGEETAPIPPLFQALGLEVLRIPHRPPALPVAAWRGVFGRWPYTLARYDSPAMRAAIRETCGRGGYAFAILNNLHMGLHYDALGSVPMILREQNVEYRWMDRLATDLGWSPKGAYARVQASRLRRAEADLCARAALVLAIQDEEAGLLRRLAPAASVETLPLGLDLDRYAPPQPADPPVILLVGALAWPPNATGAIRFLQEGWPVVQSAHGSARLRIVGRGAPPALERLATIAPGVELVGYVESIEAEFAQASVVVVPLWVGAGARVKIAESLAYRVPVAATRLAAEGLGLTPGQDYLEGETAKDLAARIIELLADPALRQALAERGRAHVAREFSLAAVARRQNELCRKAARQPAPTS